MRIPNKGRWVYINVKLLHFFISLSPLYVFQDTFCYKLKIISYDSGHGILQCHHGKKSWTLVLEISWQHRLHLFDFSTNLFCPPVPLAEQIYERFVQIADITERHLCKVSSSISFISLLRVNTTQNYISLII